MCGIFAAFGEHVTKSIHAIQRGLEVLHHRGPDSTNLWQSPTGEVVLGHTRLSIIGLCTGDQPLAISFRSCELHESLLNNLDVADQMSGRHVVNQSLYLWNKTTLPGYILTILGDRMEMSHSVEGRVPFLDHHVVEFTRSLPVTQKIHGTTEKFVLREAMRPLLTKTVYERQKHPFLAPPALLNPAEPLHQMMQDTLRGTALDTIPFITKTAVVELLDRIPTLDDGAKTGLEVPLITLLSACVLAQRFRL